MIRYVNFSQNLKVISLIGLLFYILNSSLAFCMEEGDKEGTQLTHASSSPEEKDDEDDWETGPNSFRLEVINSKAIGDEKLPDLYPILRESNHTRDVFDQAIQRILARQGSDLVPLIFRSPFCTLPFLRSLKASFDGLKITGDVERCIYETPIHEAILSHSDVKPGDKVCVANYYKRIGLPIRAGEIYLSLVSGKSVVIKRLRDGFEYVKGGNDEAKLHLMILKHHYHNPKDVDAAIAFAMKEENKEWRNEILRSLDVAKEIPGNFAVLKASRDAWKGHNNDHVKTIEKRILGHAECRNPDRRVIRDSREGQEAEEIADLIVLEKGMVEQYWSGEAYTLDDLRKAASLSSKPEKTRGYYDRILLMEGCDKTDLDNAIGFAETNKDDFELVETVLKNPLLKVPDDRLPFLKRAIAFYSTVKVDKKRIGELWREVPLSYFEVTPNIVEYRTAHQAWVELSNITVSRDAIELLNTLIEDHKDATLEDKLLVAYTCLSIPTLKEVGERKLPSVDEALKTAQKEEDVRLPKELSELESKVKLWNTEFTTKKIEKSRKKREMRSNVNRFYHYANTDECKKLLAEINALRDQKEELRTNISKANETIGVKKALIGNLRMKAYVRVAFFFSDLSTPNTKMAVQLWDKVFETDWAAYKRLVDSSSNQVASWSPQVQLSVLELQKAAQAYEVEAQFERAMLIYKRVYNLSKEWPIPLKLIQLYDLCGKRGWAQELCENIRGNRNRTQAEKDEAYYAAYNLAERAAWAASLAASATGSAVSATSSAAAAAGSSVVSVTGSAAVAAANSARLATNTAASLVARATTPTPKKQPQRDNKYYR